MIFDEVRQWQPHEPVAWGDFSPFIIFIQTIDSIMNRIIKVNKVYLENFGVCDMQQKGKMTSFLGNAVSR